MTAIAKAGDAAILQKIKAGQPVTDQERFQLLTRNSGILSGATRGQTYYNGNDVAAPDTDVNAEGLLDAPGVQAGISAAQFASNLAGTGQMTRPLTGLLSKPTDATVGGMVTGMTGPYSGSVLGLAGNADAVSRGIPGSGTKLGQGLGGVAGGAIGTALGGPLGGMVGAGVGAYLGDMAAGLFGDFSPRSSSAPDPDKFGLSFNYSVDGVSAPDRSKFDRGEYGVSTMDGSPATVGRTDESQAEGGYGLGAEAGISNPGSSENGLNSSPSSLGEAAAGMFGNDGGGYGGEGSGIGKDKDGPDDH